MAPSSIKLTYFDIEGVAEPIRLALLISGTQFEDVRLTFQEWPTLKPTVPYGQLPVMTIDDGPMLPQSKALLRMVGSKFSETLYPREKLYEIENAICVVEDFQRAWLPAFSPQKQGFPEGFYTTEEGKKLIKLMREKFLEESFPKYLEYLTTLIEKNGGKWLASTDEPTIADCFAVPLIRGFTRGHVDYIPTTCLDSHPVIVDWIKRFCALPAVKGRYTNGIF